MAPLTSKQCRALRARGHHLEPTIHIGQLGIHDAVVRALTADLAAHELVKIKVGQNCEMAVDEVARALAGLTDGDIAQVLGRTILLYRERPPEEPGSTERD